MVHAVHGIRTPKDARVSVDMVRPVGRAPEVEKDPASSNRSLERKCPKQGADRKNHHEVRGRSDLGMHREHMCRLPERVVCVTVATAFWYALALLTTVSLYRFPPPERKLA